ncbi:hypothetical protein DTO271D3_8964 [Paecilomyces variotii]|nr:hypothetical protein DTO217A2_1350 [Paecilomyces variotii]KAJ9310750.1 hypothetical protein DTO271D3_8964 [Paecilomyces variotii]KAJ9410797.1 hypothetical protein DTO045G8_1703 [Paecilomyces variotii]
MSAAASAPYLLSKIGDPIFALAIGASAAFVRIQREERERHPDRAKEIGIKTIFDMGQRRVGKWWRGEFKDL